MTDPVTIGSLAVFLLAMAANEAGRLRQAQDEDRRVGRRRRRSVGERAGVPGRQLIVVETINLQSPSDLAEVQTLALALNEALHAAAQSGAVGIDIGRLEAARVQLEEFDVAHGTGFRADEVKTTSDFTARNFDVGKPKR